MSVTNSVQRTMADEGEFADVGPELADALFGANCRQAKQRLRANSYRQAKSNYGSEAADRQKEAFGALDKAFWSGFYSQPDLSANSATANAQQFDYDEWEDRDAMPVPETQEQLTALDDFINAGLVHDTSPARLVSVFQKSNEFDAEDVERSMDGRARSVGDGTQKVRDGVPLPFSHFDYEISRREIRNSRNFGEELPTEDARKAGRALREDMEELVFYGWNREVQSNGGLWSIGGLANDESAISGTAVGEFGDPDNGPSNVLDTIDGMQSDLETQGPNDNEGYMPSDYGVFLYYATAQHGEIHRQADPRGDGNMNLARRIERDYPHINLRHAGMLNPGELVMVVRSPDVVDIANGQSPTNMSWDVEGGLVTRYKTLGMQIPRVKSTKSGKSGLVHYDGA